MRFSVRCLDVCAGEEKRILRKSAFCEAGVTEKRTLAPAVHGKAQFAQALSPKSHSATHADHRVRFSVRCLDVRAGEERRILRKSAFCEVGVTEKRILRVTPHGKAHSGRPGSRKSAFCEAGVTGGVTTRPRGAQSPRARGTPRGRLALYQSAQKPRRAGTARSRLLTRSCESSSCAEQRTHQ